MKLAITTSGETVDAALDSRFGRAPKFLIYDVESGAFTLLDNAQNLQAAQGAGVQAAEHVARAGVDAVITGHCGPKAFRVLSAVGIKVYTTDLPTVAAALAAFKAGSLSQAEGADVEGHW
ncbi:MAG: NifB/NifX family molybdenum-iron cluster-binding protein [Candidatus Eisenbacteria bacterium]|jgi:predicted Fe-Mo cluster-binding NifX family protein|nr:NifB/NifX family molybdenum-iron cluster-binding protein [Candidatus Eisenbacteria bacterium]